MRVWLRRCNNFVKFLLHNNNREENTNKKATRYMGSFQCGCVMKIS